MVQTSGKTAKPSFAAFSAEIPIASDAGMSLCAFCRPFFVVGTKSSPHFDCHCGCVPCTAFSSGRFNVTVFVVAPPAGDGGAGAASVDAPYGEGTLALDEHVAALERGDTISTKLAVNAVNGSSGTY